MTHLTHMTHFAIEAVLRARTHALCLGGVIWECASCASCVRPLFSPAPARKIDLYRRGQASSRETPERR